MVNSVSPGSKTGVQEDGYPEYDEADGSDEADGLKHGHSHCCRRSIAVCSEEKVGHGEVDEEVDPDTNGYDDVVTLTPYQTKKDKGGDKVEETVDAGSFGHFSLQVTKKRPPEGISL
jgi:hypothetical protein